jgi:hypothetical protein
MQDGYYRLKSIKHPCAKKKSTNKGSHENQGSHDEVVPIILQNANGPCPLIAICNILLLTGKFHIPPDYPGVECEELLSLLRTYISKRKPPAHIAKDKELLTNYKQNVSDVLKILPKLAVGLDVNVKFTGIRDFEFTAECIIFDLLNINLVHGWVIDPEDEAASIITPLSYNQLLEKVVAMNAILSRHKDGHIPQIETTEFIKSSPLPGDQENEPSQPNDEDPTSKARDKHNKEPETWRRPTLGQESASSATMSTSPHRLLDILSHEDQKALREGQVAQEFLSRTASQLTFYGLLKLHERIAPISPLHSKNVCFSLYWSALFFDTLLYFRYALRLRLQRCQKESYVYFSGTITLLLSTNGRENSIFL